MAKYIVNNNSELKALISRILDGEIKEYAIYDKNGKRMIYYPETNKVIVKPAGSAEEPEQINPFYINPLNQETPVEVAEEGDDNTPVIGIKLVKNDEGKLECTPVVEKGEVSNKQLEMIKDHLNRDELVVNASEVGKVELTDEIPEGAEVHDGVILEGTDKEVAEVLEKIDEAVEDPDECCTKAIDEEAIIAERNYYYEKAEELQSQVLERDKKISELEEELRITKSDTDILVDLLVNRGYKVTLTR